MRDIAGFSLNTTKAQAFSALVAAACVLVSGLVYADEVAGGKATVATVDQLRLELINDSVEVPWGIAALASGELVVTERSGGVFLIDSAGQAQALSGVPAVWSKGQGGMLDVVAHPQYSSQPWLYFSYAKPLRGGAHTAIARAKLDGTALTEWRDLYVASRPSSKGQHFGSRIALHDGYLYFSIGDRADRDANPQSLSRDGGKVYRLHDDGRVPDDNPYVGSASALPALWSYGHRNPQGLVYAPSKQQLWLHEHGPKGGDELNLIQAGLNYGWPLTTYGINYWGTRITDDTELPGVEPPVWHWTPSIAPSGMALVSAAKYPALGEGLLIGSLKFGELHFRPAVAVDGQHMRVVMRGLSRVRSLASAADGTVYVGISGEGVFRLLQSP